MPEKRRGLGRGLGALIPSSGESDDQTTGSDRDTGRPVDVFFPSAERRQRGGQQAEEERDRSGQDGKPRGGINKEALRAPDKRSGGSRKPAVSKSAPRTQAPAPNPATDARKRPAAKRGPAGGSRAQSPDHNPPETEVEPSAEIDAPVVGVVPESAGSTSEPEVSVSRETLREVPGARFAEIPVEAIHANRRQPRTVFDEEDMAELVHSVREIGVLQPIVVRESREGAEQQYELVMGERRWRASREAGLDTVPAIIRDTTDDDLLRDALLENLHRSQLNPLEEAAAYQQLLDDFGCSQEELAARIGRSRPQISNTLRLMKLPPLVQRRLAAGVLSAGHARALLGLSDQAEMEKLAQRIVAEGLSVRSTEEIVAMSDGLRRPSKSTTPRAGARHERLDYLATSLSDRLDTNVKITLGAKKGRVSIEFASVDDLNRIMGVLSPAQD